MADIYKLTYFPIKALAEPIRFLFSYGQIPFDDFRYNRDRDDWSQIKPTLPFGQVPIFEYKGKTVNQSIAIARYVAKQVKLVGKNDWEDLEIDAIVDTINDLRLKIAYYKYQKDEEIKATIKEALFKETLPFMLTRLDKIVAQNNGYLAVGQLTWADLFFVAMLDYFNYIAQTTDIIAAYPNLVALKQKVLAIPTIKSWVDKRPVTDA